MMAGNFQQMGNAGGNQVMMHQSQAQFQAQQQAIQTVLLQNIQQQTQTGTLSGWRANIPITERLGQVWHIVTQLRLTNPNNVTQDIQKMCGLALNFEKGAFDSVPDRDTYLNSLREKLGQLTNARNQVSINAQAALQAQAQAQAQAQQMGMMNQGGMPGQMARPNMGQPEAQQGFQHLQHQMQASPLPVQQPQPQQGAMGMTNNMTPQNMSQAQPQFQIPMQQQQSQQQQQQPQPAMNNRPQGAQTQFTPAEQAMILEMTNRYMAAASEEDKNNIRMNMQGRMDQATLLRYQAQGIDPLVLYYRNQVVSRLRQEKQRQLNNQQAGQGMPTNRPQSAVPMQQQRSGNPNAVGGQPQESQQQILGTADFGFLGGVDPSHQNANLVQETGQIGIPQNAQQGNTTPQPIAGLPAQGVTPNNQRVAQNPNVRAQQQFNAQQVQQERINHAANAQAQVQARAKAQAQQMGLHGQPGGMGPMPPAQSPAMNTLNAPLVRAPQQNPGAENQQLNQPNQAHFGQPIDPRFAAAMNQRAGVNGQNGGIMFPANMTQEQRQKLSALPADKLNEVIGKWNERVVPPGQQVRPAGPMPGNGQMVRPNQGMPQAGMKQQNVANQMGAQFMPNGQPIQRPNQQMMAGMNPQQQMLIQQQMANRMSQQQAQGRNMPQTPMGDMAAVNQIDHMEFPLPAVQNIPRQVPPEIKRWGQLKTWVAQNFGNMPQLLEQVKQVQRMHYQGLVRARMSQQQQRLQQQASRNMNQAGGQPQMQGGVNPAMGAPVAQMGQPQPQQNPQMAQNMANAAAVSLQDIKNARAHPSGRLANLSDEEIRETLIKNQLLNRQRQQLAQIQQQQQMHQGLMPQATGQAGPMAAAQRPTGAQQPQAQQGNAAQGQKVARPQSGQPAVQPARPQAQPAADLKQPTAAQGRAAKAKQPASSPAQPQQGKSLKRASSDDVVEVPNPNAQQAARQTQQQQTNQQQKPGQPQPPRFNLTAEQVASLTPDQRKQYIQSMQRFQQSKPQVGPLPTPEDMTRFQSIRLEELSKFKASDDLPMEPGTRQAVANKLVNTAPKLSNVSKVAPRWFAITHDEDRLRVFFRTQIKVAQQFEDQSMQTPKQSFSMGLKDVDEALNIAQNMIADVLVKYPGLSRSQGAAGPATGQPPATGSMPQPPVPQVPLNAANLQQQQQALAKQQQQNKARNRSTSKSQTPAAPTTSQPPFALNSPHGVPVMYGPPQIDSTQLHIPPKKKRKNSNGSPQAVPQKIAPPQAANAGADMRQDQQEQMGEVKQGPKVWACPEIDCDHFFNDPFATEEELEKHKLEEHVKPKQEPTGFLMVQLAHMLGLEEDGTPKKSEKADGAVDAQTVDNKGAATSAVPMKAQASATGKPSPATSSKTTKPSDGKQATPVAKQGPAKGQPAANKTEPTQENLWANSSVNPQDLLHNFQKFETGAGGAISNMDVYRSITPNDTPESSKDGLSEPNSDITEGMDLNIDLQSSEFDVNWMPFGASVADDLLGFGEITVGGVDDSVMVDSDLLANNDSQSWDQFIDFSAPDKPFPFDTSLFGMNEEL